MKYTLILVILFLKLNTSAQECNCGKDFEFLSSSFLNDYAGMEDFKIKHPEFQTKIEELLHKAKATTELKKCEEIISDFIQYLDNGHVVYGKTTNHPHYEHIKPGHSNNKLEPTLQFIDPKIGLLTIKTCDLSYKSDLDSLLLENKKKLQNLNHLILDLRGNEGGGDAMFENIIPYLYTNPIFIHTTTLWTSKNNIKMFESLLANPEIPKEALKEIQKIVETAKKNPNQFIPLSKNNIDTIVLKDVLQFPNKISILIDRNCKSSTEQFLLLAKQSKKTTIFGKTNSGGALDYSNLNFIETPSGFWYASVPTTRTTRLPLNPVDPMGIQPDILIDKSIVDELSWIIKEYSKN